MKHQIQAYFIKILVVFTAFFLLNSCSVQKKLPKDTKLYNGATYSIEKEASNRVNAKSITTLLKDITVPVKNKMIFGFPYKVWFWYAIGTPKREKGLKYWLRSKLGEAPILSTIVNAPESAKTFESHLQNKGYFKTKVSGDTTIKGYKVKANYKVRLGSPYFINEVKWLYDSTENIAKSIKLMEDKHNYLKKGKQFDLDNIKAERDRTDIFLKTLGYYYFSPDYITALVDSTQQNETVNIYLKLKNNISKSAKTPQTINRIIIFDDYTLLVPPPDTSKNDLKFVEKFYIKDTILAVNTETLVRSITYSPKDLYNIEDQNKTLNRLINLGVYKFVKNRYDGGKDTSNLTSLNVYYYLTPLKKKNINTEIGGFTKSNSYTGGQLNVNFRNRNAFHGAEQLAAKVYTAFEVGLSDSLKNNNNYRLGGDVSLTFPRFVLPLKFKENNYFPPRTRISIGYEFLRRQALFNKNFFRLQYDFTWKETANKEHSFSPLSITYNNTRNGSVEYLKQVQILPSLKLANLPELLIGGFYNFTYNTINPNAKDIVYFNGNLDFTGNLYGLVNKSNEAFSKKIAGAYFTQYLKLDFDLRYSHKIKKNVYWANRLIVGIGNPYGNSPYLPFSRQFIIGGTNSLRGFRPRQIGPGRVKTTAIQQVYLPQVGGDYKLEFNSEFRFPITTNLKAAFFTDAGNVWTKSTLLYGEGSQLTKQFLKDIAIDAGFGIRYDISILVIRIDIATPLRNPQNAHGEEWVVNNFTPFKSDWIKNNVVLNIGIGYPF